MYRASSNPDELSLFISPDETTVLSPAKVEAVALLFDLGMIARVVFDYIGVFAMNLFTVEFFFGSGILLSIDQRRSGK